MSDPASGAPALLLLTSGSYRSEAENLRALGFSDVLLKPLVRPELLLRALARAARRRAGGESTLMAAPDLRGHAGGTPESAREWTADECRVLLAEDQPVNQKLALRVLERLGCSVDVANNGAEACAMCERRDYDIVFMDCHMPEMDGFEATAAIRARAHEAGAATPSNVPIIALTANVLVDARERCLAAGMVDYVAKPLVPHVVAKTVARWSRSLV
jgi:CheY-like chemotaxis protein